MQEVKKLEEAKEVEEELKKEEPKKELPKPVEKESDENKFSKLEEMIKGLAEQVAKLSEKPVEKKEELSEVKKQTVPKVKEELSEKEIQQLERSYGINRLAARHLAELQSSRTIVHLPDGSVHTKDIEEKW